ALSLHFDQPDPYAKAAIKAFHDQHLVQQRVGCHLLAPVLGKSERHITKAAIRHGQLETQLKLSDYDALCLKFDEDLINAFIVRSRVDLTPFNIVVPPQIIDSQRSPQIG
ncbi:MAG: hypothetical protein EZS28_020506, partial [Streblomastix strix]